MKKLYKIAAFACIGFLGVGLTACGGKAGNNGSGTELALVSGVDIAGMSGEEILDLLDVNGDADITSITIKENNKTDVSWADKAEDITISDREKKM